MKTLKVIDETRCIAMLSANESFGEEKPAKKRFYRTANVRLKNKQVPITMFYNADQRADVSKAVADKDTEYMLTVDRYNPSAPIIKAFPQALIPRPNAVDADFSF